MLFKDIPIAGLLSLERDILFTPLYDRDDVVPRSGRGRGRGRAISGTDKRHPETYRTQLSYLCAVAVVVRGRASLLEELLLDAGLLRLSDGDGQGGQLKAARRQLQAAQGRRSQGKQERKETFPWPSNYFRST